MNGNPTRDLIGPNGYAYICAGETIMHPQSLIFYISAAAAAVLLFMIHQAPAATAQQTVVVAKVSEVVPTNRKHCYCKAHGPRGGCLRWTCRRQYERPGASF